VLDSFLIEITADILQQKDRPDTGKAIVDVVLDTAGQKGTGKWTSVNALDMGVPAPTVAEAVFARCLSAIKDERVAASKVLTGPKRRAVTGQQADGLHPGHPRRALLLQDLLLRPGLPAHARGAEGIQLDAQLRRNRPDLARRLHHPRGFLQKITEAYEPRRPARQPAARSVLQGRSTAPRPTGARSSPSPPRARRADPTFMLALAYYDGYRSPPAANLLQAQRDYFGAHTYERTDQPRGKFFHIDWPDASRPQIQA
jgi:6-phosphogluconate dehydrogenase